MNGKGYPEIIILLEFDLSRKREKSVANSWEREISREIVRLTTKLWDLAMQVCPFNENGFYLQRAPQIGLIRGLLFFLIVLFVPCQTYLQNKAE